jgi:hypothetical protein
MILFVVDIATKKAICAVTTCGHKSTIITIIAIPYVTAFG